VQLKKISGSLGMASCTLLQAGNVSAQAGENEWFLDSSFLIYSESDGRVSAFEPAVRGEIDLGDDEYVNFQVVVDALTGATPNGAHKSTVVQTFTNPSGNSGYTTQPGELPVNSTFRDTRVAVTGEWDKPINRLSSVLLGAAVSSEVDYTSLGLSAIYQRDFNNKNTTLATGLALTSDLIFPIGSVPRELNPMRRVGSDQQRASSDETKNTIDFILGVTQIVSRTTFFQLNYTYGASSGYHNDYNKIVTVIDPLTNEPLVGGWLDADDLPYLFEKRPDRRVRNTLFLRGVHHLKEDVIHLSYRLFSDDWGITSHTLDFKYRYMLTEKQYLQPHLRFYTQSKADFYRHDLVQGTDIDASGNVNLAYVSSDYRLGAFDGLTYGLSYGYRFTRRSEFTMRGELMQQKMDNSEVPRSGEETPDLTAVIFQMGYSFYW